MESLKLNLEATILGDQAVTTVSFAPGVKSLGRLTEIRPRGVKA